MGGVRQESALGVILFMCNISVTTGTNTKMRRALNKQKSSMYYLAFQFVIKRNNLLLSKRDILMSS